MAVGCVGSYEPFTATGLVRAGGYEMLGIFVASAAGATLAIYDDAAGGTTLPVVTAFPVVAGQWYDLPVEIAYGLSVVVTGTLSATAVMARAF